MTRVLLFDPHRGGHHLEYASRLQSAISDVDPSFSVDFLAPAPNDEYGEYFDPSEIDYLYGPSYDPEARLSEAPRRTREDLVERTVATAVREEYDIVHFLQLDDLVREVHRTVTEREPPVTVAGSIIGSYFADGPAINRVVSKLLRSTYGETFARLLPEQVNHVGRYRNDQYMYRAMRDATIDRVFVLSERAKDYLAELDGAYATEQTVVVPDPTELLFTDERGAGEARERLTLPAEGVVVLFFGEMRDEKGIHTLLDALQRYDGPQFTMVLAGSPTDVSDRELEAVRTGTVPDVRVVSEYIPDEELPLYFLAADGVVCPYSRSFGEYRTSGVFQRAAGSGRPVLAPEFGTFADRIRTWELGTTFEPESADALAATLAEFVHSGGDAGDRDRIREYARSQTYETLAERTVEAYRTTAHSR